MKNYQAAELEREVQQWWAEHDCFSTREDDPREKYYCLAMFPYPSGALHIGHVRNYTIVDAMARQRRMAGFNVLHPMGWDAFGLPAENAAIEQGAPPEQWTRSNIAAMRTELQRLGFSYDWSREFATCDPEYYRWEQWFFLRLYAEGLVYRAEGEVNWDPVDQTVLANEQVVDGRGWRSGAPVEQRRVSQWYLRITRYAEELLEALEALEGWPQQVRLMQKNWIGRSEGVEFDFALRGSEQTLRVFTTRPDTLMGTTFVALSPQHPLLQDLEAPTGLQEFLERQQQQKLSEAELATGEKEGMDTGLRAVHPFSGEELPVWVANFVLMEYGSGAIMSVPAHDQRDWEFARKYQLPIRQVIEPPGGEYDVEGGAYTGHGRLLNSGQWDGLDFADACAAIGDALCEKHGGARRVRYRLRDWSVSRQRYWGAPIPIIHCPRCGAVPTPEEQLPVLLPGDARFAGAASPLPELQSFVHTECPECGGEARRETDTFDTFVESSWYYARFCCPAQNEKMLDERARYWLPVDQYVGGIEHAVMHLLYARFFHKALRDLGLVDCDEPFTRLLSQGMVLKDGAKMSKSRGNTVSPRGLIERYGADTVRLYVLFAAPPEQSLEWSDQAVEGAHRFLKRLWRLVHEHAAQGLPDTAAPQAEDASGRSLLRKTHETIDRVNRDYRERFGFNTAIAAIMELCNAISRLENGAANRAVRHFALQSAVQLLTPVTPHICHVLWQTLGGSGTVHECPWPEADARALEREEVTVVVQINGKLRARLQTRAGTDEQSLQKLALEHEKVQRFLHGQTVEKTIVIPDKLVNIVLRRKAS